jgi:large-conductance mechanosensitive channel
VKTLNNIKKKEVVLPEAPAISTTDQLLTEIRDSLKK